MHADLLLTNIGQLVTPDGTGALRGRAMSQLRVITDAAIAIADGIIQWCGPRGEWSGTAVEEMDATRRAVTPALVDPHTHAIWAGDRLDDFERRARGTTYSEMLAAGGGIRHTIAQSRRCDAHELAALAVPRLLRLVASGAATIEVKSGYGFDCQAELTALRAIGIAARSVPAHLTPTLLIHVPPESTADRRDYLAMVERELIPNAAREHLARAVDIFVERDAFDLDEAAHVFAAARAHGLAVKAHADQFNVMGGVQLAVREGALSVDHLECSGAAEIAALAQGSTVATLLPGVSLHLGIPAAPGRPLIDAGAAVAVATDLNPGSAPLFSTQLAMALSVRINGLEPAEALTAATINAALALGLGDRGRITPGCRADLLILDSDDWRDLPYTLGGDPVHTMLIGGQPVTPIRHG